MISNDPIGFTLPVDWSEPVIFEVHPIPHSGCRTLKMSSRVETAHVPSNIHHEAENAFGPFEQHALKSAESRIREKLEEKTSLANVERHLSDIREAAERQVGRYRRAAEGKLKYVRTALNPWLENAVEVLGGPAQLPPLSSYVSDVLEAPSEGSDVAVDDNYASLQLNVQQHELGRA